MCMFKISTREKIIKTADELFYKNGFDHTSFADVASNVGISRGNFYHHFKSKDDILAAVIEHRKKNTKKMLEEWERDARSPKGRIKCYIDILIKNQTLIKEFGCPVGTLTNEMAKLKHASTEDAASIFSLFKYWLTEQFEKGGCQNNADRLALHVLSWSQGTVTIYNAFKDDDFLKNEIRQIESWLDLQIKEN